MVQLKSSTKVKIGHKNVLQLSLFYNSLILNWFLSPLDMILELETLK